MSSANNDIEEQRRLAKDWRPDVNGPLVGPVTPTSAVLGDFESSDARHGKIANLVSAFPHYRSMKGDGSCGFRALTLGYLLALSTPAPSPSAAAQRLRAAGAHFTSLQALFEPRGWDAFIYEDWLAACVQLCDDLAAAVESPADAAAPADLLVARLNDDEASVEILQYLRAVTSSYMLAHEADFAPFVLDEPRGLQGWCELNVDPPSAELDEQSLLAFYRAVVERSGLAVHVHYLEQSAGDRLHVSEYKPEGKEGEGVVNLLYRPGHYDLLLDS